MIPEIKHGTPILAGLTGSRLYGLDHADSDYDWKAVYKAPTLDFLGLHQPAQTQTSKDPDFTAWEVGHFISLLLKSNPTVMEMLWLPEYEVLTRDGQLLVDLRQSFLTQKVRTVYYGFGVGQLKRFRAGGNGDAKAARHFYRVLEQGEGILREGILRPKPADPAKIWWQGDYAEADPEGFLAYAEVLLERFDQIPSDLPAEPNVEEMDILLKLMRVSDLTAVGESATLIP
jgi:uncharacterized protein